MKFIFYGLIGVVILFIGFLFLPGNPNTIAPSGANQVTNGEIIKIAAAINNRSYTPSSIDVPLGSTIELTVTNNDNEQHGIGIPTLGIQDFVGPLQTKTVRFEAAQLGEINTFCSTTHPEKLIINVI